MLSPRFFFVFLTAALAFLAFGLPDAALAQQRVAIISPQQAVADPYRNSGRLDVSHGNMGYIGSATLIRRYTALTAGHLLYDGDTGFSTNVSYEPGLYVRANVPSLRAGTFAVLTGYQDQANIDGDSDAAFARDFGYVLFLQPTPNGDWANWQALPAALLQPGPKLAFGYAAETLTGNALASVSTNAAFYVLRDGLYETTDYYTQAGMSGGPLYATIDGVPQVVAEIVAGTSPPARAYSDVRAITAAERPLLIDAEYKQGLIKGGIITGPQTASAGSSAVFKAGLIFTDNTLMGKGGLKVRYDELKLMIPGANKRQVLVQTLKPGKFQVTFGKGLESGTPVELRLIRDTAKTKDQTPLKTYVVTVQ